MIVTIDGKQVKARLLEHLVHGVVLAQVEGHGNKWCVKGEDGEWQVMTLTTK